MGNQNRSQADITNMIESATQKPSDISIEQPQPATAPVAVPEAPNYQNMFGKDYFEKSIYSHKQFEYTMESRRQMLQSMNAAIQAKHEATKNTIQNLRA